MLLWLCGLGPVAAQDSHVAVPFALESPYIDGNVHSDEWSGAHVVALPDSSEVLFLRDAEHLYVALCLSRKGFGSLCIQKNEQVRVLHASAALGTAVYTRNEDAWRLVEPFNFTMRETGDPTELQQKRTDFLEMHGWVASTVDMGDGDPILEQEYAIRIGMLDSQEPILGVVAMLLDPEPSLAQIPGALEDGCADMELVQGFAPENVQFNPSGWLLLDLGREVYD